MNRVCRGSHTLALCVILATMSSASAVAQVPGTPPQTAQKTPLELFRPMVPVISHPRCVNCHQGIDAHSGRGHDPGPITTEACNSCHESVPDKKKGLIGEIWHQPSNPDLSFVGKNEEQLCAQFADFVMHAASHHDAIEHVEKDTLIGFAFVGLMGGARDPSTGDPPAAPPPMSKAEFVDHFKTWVDQGHAACTMEGTITQVETVESDTTILQGNTTHTEKQRGLRTVKLEFRGGQWHVQTKTDGEIVQTTVAHATDQNGRPCTMSVTVTDKYSGSKSGIAKVTTQGKPDSTYLIEIELPPETLQSVQKTQTVSSCNVWPPDDPPDQQTLAFDEWTFVIEGHAHDKQRKNFTGACDRITLGVHTDPNDRFACFREEGDLPPWIWNHGAAPAWGFNGKDIPFRTVTLWNVSYK